MAMNFGNRPRTRRLDGIGTYQWGKRTGSSLHAQIGAVRLRRTPEVDIPVPRPKVNFHVETTGDWHIRHIVETQRNRSGFGRQLRKVEIPVDMDKIWIDDQQRHGRLPVRLGQVSVVGQRLRRVVLHRLDFFVVAKAGRRRSWLPGFGLGAPPDVRSAEMAGATAVFSTPIESDQFPPDTSVTSQPAIGALRRLASSGFIRTEPAHRRLPNSIIQSSFSKSGTTRSSRGLAAIKNHAEESLPSCGKARGHNRSRYRCPNTGSNWSGS